jgi:hypothetical protein
LIGTSAEARRAVWDHDIAPYCFLLFRRASFGRRDATIKVRETNRWSSPVPTNYDSILRELGYLPPVPSFFDSGALIARIRSSAGRPSPLAKALSGFEARATKRIRETKALLVRHAEDPKVAHRAKLAEFQRRADDLVRGGNLTAAEGALLDVHLNRYAERNCQ